MSWPCQLVKSSSKNMIAVIIYTVRIQKPYKKNIHPRSLTWNLKKMVSKFEISFSRGWFLGFMFNFRGFSALTFTSAIGLMLPPGMYKTLLKWDKLPTSTGAGFLPSTIVSPMFSTFLQFLFKLGGKSYPLWCDTYFGWQKIPKKTW